MKLEWLVGEHIFSGCELIPGEDFATCLFVLDGNTYKAEEDPEDGYRSWCNDLEITYDRPHYTFPGIEVICSMKERDCEYEHSSHECDILVITDKKNGKLILEVGTNETNSYYPYCVFHYRPENMSCNEDLLDESWEDIGFDY
jgi:hypothetical protein